MHPLHDSASAKPAPEETSRETPRPEHQAPNGVGSSAAEGDHFDETGSDGDSRDEADGGSPTEPAREAAGAAQIKPRTLITYTRALKTMIRAAEDKRRGELDETDHVPVTLTNLVEDLAEREDLASGTVNIYRSALLWHARNTAATSTHPGLVEEAKAMTRVLESFRKQGGRPKNDGAVPIPELDYSRLLAELLDRAVEDSDWAARAHAWLMAGVITGVRPAEWPGARWAPDDERTLEVTTGKVKLSEPAFIRAKLAAEDLARHGPGRTPPATRLIRVERAFDREVVQTHLEYLAAWLRAWRHSRTARGPGRPPARAAAAAQQSVPLDQLAQEEIDEAYTAYYNGVRSVIRRACLKLWGGERMYSLYSARHQFSANARAEVGPAAAAELMGHTRPDSPSAAHYPSRHAAHSRSRASAGERLPHQVAFQAKDPASPQLREVGPPEAF